LCCIKDCCDCVGYFNNGEIVAKQLKANLCFTMTTGRDGFGSTRPSWQNWKHSADTRRWIISTCHVQDSCLPISKFQNVIRSCEEQNQQTRNLGATEQILPKIFRSVFSFQVQQLPIISPQNRPITIILTPAMPGALQSVAPRHQIARGRPPVVSALTDHLQEQCKDGNQMLTEKWTEKYNWKNG